MDPNAITEGASSREKRPENADGDSITATNDHRDPNITEEGSRTTSVGSFSTNSSTSVTSEGSMEKLNKTVVAVEPDFKIQIEVKPDYKALYQECKRLLDEKTEKLRKEIATLSVDYKTKNDEFNILSDSHRKLELSKLALEKELEENGKMQNSPKQPIRGIQASYLHLNRNADDMFKVKPKKRSNSKASLNTNKCEVVSCGAEGMDLVRCDICLKYVCETCNEIPVGKLKSIIKTCNRFYFLCKLCLQKCDEAEVELQMTKLRIDDNEITKIRQLQIEIEAKQKIIATLEQTQQPLNEVLADKDELIDNLAIETTNCSAKHYYSRKHVHPAAECKSRK